MSCHERKAKIDIVIGWVLLRFELIKLLSICSSPFLTFFLYVLELLPLCAWFFRANMVCKKSFLSTMLYRSQQAPRSNCFIVVASKYSIDDDKAHFISIFYYPLQRQRNTFVSFDLYTFVLHFALFSFSWLCFPCRAPASMLFRWISILFVLFPFVSVFFLL